MSRTRRATWNYASNILFAAVTMATGMISTPWIIRYVGEARFGAFRAAFDLGGYVTLLELGIGGAIMAMLGQAVGRGDVAAVRQGLGAGLRAATRVSAMMAVAGVGLVLAAPHLIAVDASLRADLQVGLAVGLLGSILPFPLMPYRVLAEASQRSYLVNAAFIVQCLVVTVVSLVLARAGLGITGLFIGVVSGSILPNLILAWDGSRRDPGLRRPWPRHPEADRDLWRLNWPSLVTNFCGRASLLTDSLIIAYFLGPKPVAVFYLTQRLAVIAQGQIQAIAGSTWAALAELYVTGQRALFVRRFVELNKLVAVVGLSMLVPIAAYNHRFVALWTGAESFGGEALNLLAIINAFLLATIGLWTWIFVGTGRLARLVPVNLATTAINVPVSVAATYYLGLCGPLLGTLVASLGFTLWRVAALLRDDFGVPSRALFGSIGRQLVVGVPYAAGVWWIAHAHTPRGWIGLGAEMVATALAYPLLAWCLLFTAEERAVWRARFLPSRRHPAPAPAPHGRPDDVMPASRGR